MEWSGFCDREAENKAEAKAKLLYLFSAFGCLGFPQFILLFRLRPTQSPISSKYFRADLTFFPMAQVMNMPLDSLEKPDKSPSATADAVADDDSAPPPPPPPPPSQPQQTLPVRRRDRDSRERMDDRDGDRPRNRRGSGADHYDRNLSPPPRDRERDFKRRRSPSPPYRDRRHSPPRRSSPPLHFKRSRRDDGGYDRRGSPRGGFGPDDRRLVMLSCLVPCVS